MKHESKEEEQMEATEILPDEIWRKIFEIGTRNSTLLYTDLCSLSQTCNHFIQLSTDNTLWSISLALNFPEKAIEYSSYSCSSLKSLYQYTNTLNAITDFENFSDNLLCLIDFNPFQYRRTLGVMCGENSPIFAKLRGKYAQMAQSIKDAGSDTSGDILPQYEEKKNQIISYRKEAFACEKELEFKIDSLLGRQVMQSDDSEEEEEEEVEDDNNDDDHDA